MNGRDFKMKRNPLPFLISPHSEIDGKLNDEINVQAAREYARRPLDEAEKSTDAAKARARAMELLAGQELSSGGLYERLNRRFAGQTAAAVR